MAVACLLYWDLPGAATAILFGQLLYSMQAALCRRACSSATWSAASALTSCLQGFTDWLYTTPLLAQLCS